ncbi:MAG: M16 family metallopeptidase [Mangrovibacterium sp.]
MIKRIITLLLGALFGFTASAQFNPDALVPQDVNVRYGVLSNGLTYYIRHNNFPEGYAHFEIIHAVGALQEEDNQNGLAHFLEHLAFNGLKHFPGKSMLEYMERIGVKFGENLNAATSADYTRYLIKNVPTLRQGVIDTSLQVLYDWSGSILCDQEEIDAERGVIEEEWRSRGDVRYRISEAIAPYVYNHSKYARRNVIGNMEIIRNFKREELVDFYHTWYRPDLQAIVIVGDFDADKMETQVKELFSQLPAATAGKPKETYQIPDNSEMLYATYSDKEATSSSIEILFKHPSVKQEARNIVREYARSYQISMITSMMNSRLKEIVTNGNFPVNQLGYFYGNLGGDRDVFSISAQIKKGGDNIPAAFDMMLRESERIRRYGFTPEELSREKADKKRNVERAYLERDKRTNDRYVQDYFNHFLNNNPYPDMQTYYDLRKQIIDDTTLEDLNTLVKTLFRDDNQVVTIITPSDEASSIPAEAFVENRLASCTQLAVTPYEEKVLGTSLLKKEPVPGKVINETKNEFGATEWTLSNGIKVYLYPTALKKDEILMDAFSWGGHSVVRDKEFIPARLVSTAMSESGAGTFNATDLAKMLTGKIVYVTPILGEFFETFGCASTPSDYETMLQVVYLYFTSPRFDEDAFNKNKQKIKENLVSRKNMPFSYLQDSVTMLRSNYHFRASNLILDPDDVDKANLRQVKVIQRKLFDNPQQFTFFFTGAIDPEKAKPIVEKYIGSLKGAHRHADQWKDVGKRPPKGVIRSDFTRPMETPKSTVFIEYTKETDYSLKKSITMAMLKNILDIRYTRLIREDKGGTYSVDMEGSLSRLPVPVMHLIISFTTRPEMMNELEKIVHEELDRLVKEGIDPDDLVKSREFMLKSITQSKEGNYYWHSALRTYLQYGENTTHSEEVINSISKEDIQAALKELIEANNMLTVVLRPE